MTDSDNPEAVRWGICGTGRIAQKMVGELAAIADARVVSVASRSADRAAEFAADHGIPRSHSSYEALAADDEVDVVYVATTQEGHHDTVVMMLEGGRAVLCEKPLAMNAAQVASMCDVASREGKFLMEAMWSRFSDAWRTARSLIEGGRIGQPALLRADLSLSVPQEMRATHRLMDPARGGGALMDVGVYPLNLAVFLFGQPLEVAASGVLPTESLDLRASALLQHGAGVTSLVSTGIDFEGGADARISGTEGAVMIEPRMHASGALVLESGGATERIECEPPGLGIQVPEVHRCIRSDLLESPVMSWDESLAMHRLTDRIRAEIGLSFDADGSNPA
ncbi:MAG: Gfo/Idh/MocA family protein [Microthrixaceae bacterium]